MPPVLEPILLCVFGPLGIYLALKRPLIFPFGLNVMMVPFDNLFAASSSLTRLVATATAAVLVLHLIAMKRVLLPPKSWTPWLLYIVLASLTIYWTVDVKSTTLTLQTMVQLFLFYTILTMFPASREDVRIIGAMVVASGTLLSTIGIYQYSQGIYSWAMPGDLIAPGTQLRLTLRLGDNQIDPNHIAASLLLPIALAVGTILMSRNTWLKLCALVGAGMMLSALFLTGSRGGLIALAVMFLYFALKTRYRVQILGLMSLAGMYSLFLPTVWARFNDKGLQGGSGRTDIWRIGEILFQEHWLTGVGIGAFKEAYNQKWHDVYQAVFQGWNRPAHNAYLSAACELGVFGFLLFIYGWYRTWKDAQGNVVIEASIIGLAIASFFLDVMFLKYFWLTFIMTALARNAAEPRYLIGSNRVPKALQLAHDTLMKRKLELQKPKNIVNAPQRPSWREEFANRRARVLKN